MMDYFKLLVMRPYWYQHLILVILSLTIIAAIYLFLLRNEQESLTKNQQTAFELEMQIDRLNQQLQRYPSKTELMHSIDILAINFQSNQDKNIQSELLMLTNHTQVNLLSLRRYQDNQLLLELSGDYQQLIQFIYKLSQSIAYWQITQISVVSEDDALILSLILNER